MYRNPVYPHYFADPFVLRFDKKYFAYGTAPADASGNHFPILTSPDLVNWQYIRHALPAATPFAHWAPEVARGNDGRFYLFYSASNLTSDDGHRLRVAVAESPQGPFADSGKLLVADVGFSIDAHPFRDPQSGKWFLYFAMDFTDDVPHGTGLAVVELRDDLLAPRGKVQPLLRASCSWQVYERNRHYKGQVWESWHCIEGPFVIYREGRYFLLYSGGAWHTGDYGVGWAIASSPLGPFVEQNSSGGPPVLRADPPRVIGPGHASVTSGPDDATDFLVYHAWDSARIARRMCIDPLRWTQRGPVCDGPSTTEREIAHK